MLDLKQFNENYDKIEVFRKTKKLSEIEKGTELVVVDDSGKEHILIMSDNGFTWKDGD